MGRPRSTGRPRMMWAGRGGPYIVGKRRQSRSLPPPQASQRARSAPPPPQASSCRFSLSGARLRPARGRLVLRHGRRLGFEEPATVVVVAVFLIATPVTWSNCRSPSTRVSCSSIALGLSNEIGAAMGCSISSKAAALALVFGVGRRVGRVLGDSPRARVVVGHRRRRIVRWSWWRSIQLAPVLLLPLFYSFKPLERPALVERLIAARRRAPARESAASTSGRSAPTPRRPTPPSPAWAGPAASCCRTRCWPTTQTTRSKSCWRTSCRTTCITICGAASRCRRLLLFVGCYVASVALGWLAEPLELRGLDDPAGMPLLMLAAGLCSFVFMPRGQRDVARARTARRSLRARHARDSRPRSSRR